MVATRRPARRLRSRQPIAAPDDDAMEIVVMSPFDPSVTASTKGPTRMLPERLARHARIYASYRGARVTAPMRLRRARGEPPTEFGKIIALHERIKRYTNRQEGSLPEGKELKSLGESLFRTLFPPPIQRLYDEARARQKGRKLDLIFTSMVPWIAEKPWEFAYDGERKRFIATEEVNFIRNVLTCIPSDAVEPDPECLRILVVSAQPLDLERLGVAHEVALIRRGFEPLVEQGLVELDTLPRATPRKLLERLAARNYSVVHFIGHGDFNDQTQEGALIFENEDGSSRRLGGENLRQILCNRGLSLVFLNACLTGTGGRGADFNKGVAQSLVEQGLPALVANQYSVLDTSATSFAYHFYTSLAHGMPLARAARESRIAVNLEIDGEIIDWAVPVVYARDPNAVLCAPKRARRTPSTRRAAKRSSRAGARERIAVWDMDNVFPSLNTTLARMNDAQSHFLFELVDLSPPLDIWDMDYTSPDGTPYLWAEKLAKRFRTTASELGVKVLACVTRHWLTDDHELNLYGWWPASRRPPVVIFSCAGFDELPAEGAITDRVIANAAVSGLAGFYGRLDSHTKGARDCPLYYNPERDYQILSGPQKFDPDCGKKLALRYPKEFAAFEKLLAAVATRATKSGSTHS